MLFDIGHFIDRHTTVDAYLFIFVSTFAYNWPHKDTGLVTSNR